jgi:hypothetical protein
MEFDRSSQVFRQDVFAGFFFLPNGGHSIYTPLLPNFNYYYARWKHIQKNVRGVPQFLNRFLNLFRSITF